MSDHTAARTMLKELANAIQESEVLESVLGLLVHRLGGDLTVRRAEIAEAFGDQPAPRLYVEIAADYARFRVLRSGPGEATPMAGPPAGRP